jgi:hypothetical protein
MTRLRDPQYGDRFQEMLSVWMHVIGRIGPLVVVHILGGWGGKVKVFTSPDEFAKSEAYSTNAESSPWLYHDNIGDSVLGYLHTDYLKAGPDA